MTAEVDGLLREREHKAGTEHAGEAPAGGGRRTRAAGVGAGATEVARRGGGIGNK